MTETPGMVPSFPVRRPTSSVVASMVRVITETEPRARGRPVRARISAACSLKMALTGPELFSRSLMIMPTNPKRLFFSFMVFWFLCDETGKFPRIWCVGRIGGYRSGQHQKHPFGSASGPSRRICKSNHISAGSRRTLFCFTAYSENNFFAGF